MHQSRTVGLERHVMLMAAIAVWWCIVKPAAIGRVRLARAQVAQSAEQRFCKPQVVGSTPALGSLARDRQAIRVHLCYGSGAAQAWHTPSGALDQYPAGSLTGSPWARIGAARRPSSAKSPDVPSVIGVRERCPCACW